MFTYVDIININNSLGLNYDLGKTTFCYQNTYMLPFISMEHMN